MVMGARLPSDSGDFVQRIEFGLALDIELMNAGFEAELHFRVWFFRRRKRRCGLAGMPAASAFFNSPPETTSAPAPSLRQRFQHGEIAVRLHRDRRSACLSGTLARTRGNAAPVSRWNSNRTACRPHPRVRTDRRLRRKARPSRYSKWFIGRWAAAVWTDLFRPLGVSLPLGMTRSLLMPQDGTAMASPKIRSNAQDHFSFSRQNAICSRTRTGAVPPKLVRELTRSFK